MRPMILAVLLMMVAMVVLVLAGCGGYEDSYSPDYPTNSGYPNADSPLYFYQTAGGWLYVGLGGYELSTPDDRTLSHQPGFEIAGGHAGGYGDTLEVVSFSNGMYFYWAHDMLFDIYLFDGWKGELYTGLRKPTGIRLMSPIADFLTVFPEVEQDSPNSYGGISYRTSITSDPTDPYASQFLVAHCGEDGKIRSITVSYAEYTDFANIGYFPKATATTLGRGLGAIAKYRDAEN